jgi:PAS domain-containing protein
MSSATPSTAKGQNPRLAASQRKRGEEAMRASDLHCREIVDGTPALIAVMNAAVEVEVVNRRVLEYFDKPVEESKSWTNGNAVHPDDLPTLAAARGLSVETGHPFESDHRQRRWLLRPDADNDVIIGPGVVGQIPIGSNVVLAGTIRGRSSNDSKLKIGR